MASLPLTEVQQVMLFKMCEEFVDVSFDNLAGHGKLTADLIGDLPFRTSDAQEFEHSGSYEVQTEHLPVADVEDDGAILAVSRAHFLR